MKVLKICILLVVCFCCFSSCKKRNIVPLPPTDLTAIAYSTTQVNLAWKDRATNEDGYKIQRKVGNDRFVDISSVPKDITTYQDINVQASTTYTYRVYAYNTSGESLTYSNEATVSTFGLPILTTKDITNITAYGCLTGGNIINDGMHVISAKGVVWDLRPNPTISLLTKTNDGAGNNNFISSISNLSPNTTYYIRAYATNLAGTSYGNELVFKTGDIYNGAVAFYPFTGTAIDSSGNGNHGVVFGAQLTSDRFGNSNRAYQFNGLSDDIRINLSSINNKFLNGIDMTINAWVKTSDLNGPIVAFREPAVLEFNVGCLTDIVNSPGKIGVLVRNDVTNAGTGNYVFSKSINDDKWHMLTLTRISSSGILQIYIDGNLEAASSVGQNGSISFKDTWMSIGSEQNWIQTNFSTSIDQEYFLGKIDDVAIWNRVLTNNEIKALYTIK